MPRLVMPFKRSKTNSPAYQIRLELARFPTGALPDSIQIIRAQLLGRIVTLLNPENRSLICEFYSASNWPIDIADYTVNPPAPAGVACQMPLAVGTFTVDLDPTLAEQNINRLGDTGMRLHMSANAPIPPTANSTSEIEAWENSGTNQLCLRVTFVTVP